MPRATMWMTLRWVDMPSLSQITVLLFISMPAFGGEALYERALSSYNRTDYAGVIQLLGQSATDAKSLTLLGQAYMKTDEFRRASEALERAAVLDPDNSTIQDWLGRAYGRRAGTAFPLAALGLATRTRSAFEKAVRLNPANGEAVDDLFEFYLQAPGVLGGGLAKARSLLPLVDKNDAAEGHYARARILEQEKDFDQAETELRKSMEADPGDVGRMIDLARFLADRGRVEDSDVVFRRAEKVNPESRRLMYARAECWIYAKRKLNEANQLLKRYLASTDLTPDDISRADAWRLMMRASGN